MSNRFIGASHYLSGDLSIVAIQHTYVGSIHLERYGLSDPWDAAALVGMLRNCIDEIEQDGLTEQWTTEDPYHPGLREYGYGLTERSTT
jgi:hypothetical protein